MLHKFQKLQVDPLGIGDFIRSKTPNWEEEKWKQQYPDMPIHINVDVHIVDMGAIL